MPVPTPNSGEEQGTFISRCASALADTDPDRPNEQRVAMCYTSWRRAKGGKLSEEDMLNMPDLKFALFSEEGKFSSEGSKLWRKQVLRFGTWKHPNDKDVEFEITPELVKQMATNFEKGIPAESPIVLTHTDNPLSKVGSVKKFIPTETGLDALFSVEDEGVNGKITSEESVPGVSCWLDLNYHDKQDDTALGAVVKHVALVNHPYIDNLGGFKTVALSEADDAEKFVPLILSEEEKNKKRKEMPKEFTKESAIAFLKEKEKIDVTTLLSSDEELKTLHDRIDKGELRDAKDAGATLSEDLIKEIRNQIKLGEDVKTATEVVKALMAKVTELSGLEKKVEEVKTELSAMKADTAIDGLMRTGMALPAEKKVLKELFLTDPKLFDKMAEARKEHGKPLVELSEEGVVGKEEKEKEEKKEREETLERNVDAGREEGYIPEKKS